MSRLAVILVLALAGAIALTQDFDILRMVIWSLSLVGAAFFPALTLSIWWKRVTAAGILFGMISGFGVTLAIILAGEFDDVPAIFGIESLTAGIAGVPVGFVIAMVISLLGKAPDAATREMVDDMRVASGENIHDRAQRLSVRGGKAIR